MTDNLPERLRLKSETWMTIGTQHPAFRDQDLSAYLIEAAAEIARLRAQVRYYELGWSDKQQEMEAEIERIGALWRAAENNEQLRAAMLTCQADEIERLRAEIERLRAALVLIAEYRSVSLAQEWPEGLHDVIRSIIDCAERALEPKP